MTIEVSAVRIVGCQCVCFSIKIGRANVFLSAFTCSFPPALSLCGSFSCIHTYLDSGVQV